MAKRRFRLNSLSRYSKESDRLILDSYSAGCGGIVLRWRDPNEGLPIRFYVQSSSALTMFLDGQPVENTTTIKPGEHLMAIRCLRNTETDPQQYGTSPSAIAMLIGAHLPSNRRDYVSGFGSTTSWLHETVQAQKDYDDDAIPNWATVSYDDSNWLPMEDSPTPTREENWTLNYLIEQGAHCLALPDADEVHIRYRFTWERSE